MARSRAQSGAPASWRWASIGASVGLLAAIVVFAPAHWLASAVAAATNGQVVLGDPRGTVWRGSAQLTLTGGPGSRDAAALPGRIDWRIAPRFNGIAATLQAACCLDAPLKARMRVRAGGGSMWIGPANLALPAGVLAGLGTPWNTLQLEGDLRLATRGLSVEWVEGRMAVTGGADLVAHNVSSRLSTLRPMGSYRIQVTGGTAPAVRLATLEGPLRLTGAGQWVGRRLRFAGEASAEPEYESALSNLLNIIGRRTGARSQISIG